MSSLPVCIPLFIIAGIVIIISAFYIAKYVDIYEEKSKASSSLLAGLLLGWVTSLPELIMMIVFISEYYSTGNQSYIIDSISDILGGNFLNLACLGILSVLFIKNIKYFKPSLTEYINVGSLILVYVLYLIGFVGHSNLALGKWINISSIIIFAIYIINTFFMFKDTKVKEFQSQIKTRFSLNQLKLVMLMLAVILVGMSVLFSFVAEPVIDATHLKENGAAIMLGIITSLPEVIAAAQLFRMKNSNAAFSELIGSSCSNTVCLVVADIIYNKDLFAQNGEKNIIGNITGIEFITILTFCCLLCFAGSIALVRLFKAHKEKVWCKITVGSCFAIPGLMYGAYIVLSLI